jgi:phosphoribosylanthranilate isomerase
MNDPARARPRPWVKVCGVTRPEDADLAARLGAALVGVNFWRGSKRRVERAAAREIAAALAGRAELVGVFVNEEPERIEELAGEVGLDRVQLHGDEPDAVVARFGARALRGLRTEGRVARLVDACERVAASSTEAAGSAWEALLGESGLSLPRKLFALVLDSPAAGARYGGTGEGWEWRSVRALCGLSPAPVLIAGGVVPETAREILEATGAAGIDVASGVESTPGVKDHEKMERLFEEVARVRR